MTQEPDIITRVAESKPIDKMAAIVTSPTPEWARLSEEAERLDSIRNLDLEELKNKKKEIVEKIREHEAQLAIIRAALRSGPLPAGQPTIYFAAKQKHGNEIRQLSLILESIKRQIFEFNMLRTNARKRRSGTILERISQLIIEYDSYSRDQTRSGPCRSMAKEFIHKLSQLI